MFCCLQISLNQIYIMLNFKNTLKKEKTNSESIASKNIAQAFMIV